MEGLPTYHERDGADLGFFGQRRLRKARAALEPCDGLGVNAPGLSWIRGRLSHVAGTLAEAKADLEVAARGFPSEVGLLTDLTLINLSLGDGVAASTYGRAAVDLVPDDDDLKVAYAYAVVLEGHPKRALGILANVCKRDPDHSGARVALDVVRKIIDGKMDPPGTIGPTPVS